MPNVTAALPNTGGALSESSFLVPRRNLAHVHCSSANIGQGKTWTRSEFCTWQNSLRGQEPRKNVYTVYQPMTAKHRAKFG